MALLETALNFFFGIHDTFQVVAFIIDINKTVIAYQVAFWYFQKISAFWL